MDKFISRAFTCTKNHSEAERHVVFGKTRQSLIVYDIKYDVIDNITPHIISFVKIDEQRVAIAVTCGIIGCGVDFKNPNDLNEGLIFNEVREYVISKKDFDALKEFKQTGYEIS